MAKKTDHVLLRDGSASLGGPRPMPPARPAKAPPEADGGGGFAGEYTDSHVNGWYDATGAFKAASGTPSPRQRAARGEPGFGEHIEPDRSEELIRKAAPLT